MKKVLLFAFLLVGLFVDAQTYSIIKNNCQLEVYQGSKLSFNLNIRDIVWSSTAQNDFNLEDDNRKYGFDIRRCSNYPTRDSLYRTINRWKLSCYGGSDSAWSLIGNHNTDSTINYLGTDDNNPLIIKTNNQNRIKVMGGGSVGINTNAPTNTLDINGSLRVRGLSVGSMDSIIGIDTNGVLYKMASPSGGGGSYTFSDSPSIDFTTTGTDITADVILDPDTNNVLIQTSNGLLVLPEALSTLNYVTPEQYGAIGNGTTDDATAIQNAINSGKTVLFGTKNYLVNTTLTLPANSKILGLGKSSIMSTTTNIPIINILGNNITIESLSFFGNSTGTSQVGVDFVGNGAFSLVRHANNITNCFFSNFGGSGVRATNIIGSSSGSNHEGVFIMSNSMFSNCNIAINLLVRAEYCCINNCNIYNCTTGIVNTGGNNSITGGQITGCTTGYSLLSGANDGHCTANGVKINHNTTNISNATTNGYTFEGCSIYAGSITSTGAGLLRFIGCDISYNGGNLTITNAPIQFINCVFATNPSTVTLTGKQPLFINCYTVSGTTVYVYPTRTYTPSNVFSSNGTLFIPLGTNIESITILNTTGNAVTGGIRIGTTAGGADVVASLAIPANGLISVSDATILKKAFSNTANQTLFVEAIGAWNSASITVNIKLQQNIF